MSKATDQEAIFGVVPVLKAEKKYGFIDTLLTTSGYAIATWCYTQGALMAQSMGFRELIASIFSLNILGIIIISLMCLFAIRYGVDIWVYMKSMFGEIGQKVIAVACIVMILPWFSVCADLFAGSMMELVGNFGVGLLPIMRKPIGLICVILGMVIALGGPGAIKWTNRFMVTALLAVGVIAGIVAFTAVPIDQITGYTPQDPMPDAYALNLEASIAFAFSWAMGVAVIPRMSTSERKGYWATSISYGVVAPAFVFIGGVMALAMFAKTGIMTDDPTVILSALGGPAVALLSLLLVAFANIGTAGTGTYIYSMILKAAFPKYKFKWFAIITTGYMALLTIWGGAVEHFGAFISFSAFLLAPITGAMLVDYFILRRQKVSLRKLYNPGKNYNALGLIAVALGLIAGVFTYNPATGEIVNPLFYVFTGSGLSCIVGAVSYWILSVVMSKRLVGDDSKANAMVD